MKGQPTGIELDRQQGTLVIAWSDGRRTRHSMRTLRRLCPCAACRAERQKMEAPGPTLRVIQGPTPPTGEALVVDYSPVGRYALSFTWNDGHSTGIYSYEFLLEHQAD